VNDSSAGFSPISLDGGPGACLGAGLAPVVQSSVLCQFCGRRFNGASDGVFPRKLGLDEHGKPLLVAKIPEH
jgi:hypothetical protein